ncbi:MAG: hypothetical protein JWQ38_3146 [Flavipsychrobacter sp.]|nr:hypothetical protein [Flavipsychrobacter sp.]
MDKNFINIDDLVRQRLGGGEEQEQAGSWGRMRDLLDKEMPQKKPAGMYWRRSLSAIALLLFVAGASVGGYMMANKKTAPGMTTGDLASATINNNHNTAANTGNNIATEPAKNNVLSANTTTASENKNLHVAATAKQIEDADAKPYAISNEVVKEKKQHKAPVTVANANSKPSVTHRNIAVAKNDATKKDGQLAATEPKTLQEKTAKRAAAVHEKISAPTKSVAGVADKKNNTDNSNIPATDSKETMGAMALGSNMPSSTPSVKSTAGVTHKTANTHKKASHDKVAANGDNKTAPVAKSKAATNAPVADADNNSADEQTAIAHKNNKRTAAKTVATANVPKHKTAAMPANVATMPLASAAPTANNTTAKTASLKPTHKAQRQVQRLVLTQRMVRVSPTEVKYILDTISLENATEEYDLVSAPVYGPQTYEKYINSIDETSTVAVAKENHVKKAKGTSSIENLSAAFNDMKTKVKGANFATGLTAGINGTFFGPNSFKGFQFGATGTFTFSETLAIMGELKYFHRINSDYTLNDNYYTYTPSAAGGYTRVMVNNPYSFSTLHSIELPISVRYCTGNFNFFFGGNVEYSFAINTGAYPLADQTTMTQVATIGNDNTPKIQNDDFSSRFGFGYLVGASYRVNPNVMIDFRSVQNTWDNSKTQGAKIISSQLYRSPSLQLSVGYRLGGHKERNKD